MDMQSSRVFQQQWINPKLQTTSNYKKEHTMYILFVCIVTEHWAKMCNMMIAKNMGLYRKLWIALSDTRTYMNKNIDMI